MKILKFICLSVLLHLIIFLFDVAKDEDYAKPEHIKVTFLHNGVKSARQKEKSSEDKKEDLKLSGQIVDLPLDHNSERPDDASFLSETDHKTERETISRHSNLSNEQSGHEKTQANDLKDSESKSLGTDSETKEESHKRELPRVDQRDRLTLDRDLVGGVFKNDRGSDALKGKGQGLHIGQDSKNVDKSTRGAKKINLFPDKRTLTKIASAPFADAIDDVEEGEGTFLNTFEFKYATFFNRVKRSVVNRWHPLPLLKQRDPTGHIYGQRNRKTVLDVVLDGKGSVVSVNIKASSGVDFLDKEAQDSFWRVQQFPNPPKGMVKNSEVRFDFGFSVSFNRRRIF